MKRTMLMLSATCALLATGVGVTGNASADTTAANGATASSGDDCKTKHTQYERDQCERFKQSAAGDEYFGRMKMSFLGINNTFRDEAIRAGAYTTDPSLINRLTFADEALNDWSKKHPNDPDLARSYFLAIQVYKKVYIRPYQDKAWQYMQIEMSRFGSTYFGKLVKADVARGYTEHYFDNPTVCPTPLPSGVVPEATPDATPTPAPKKGQPKIDLITPPCVPPKSPSPEPSAVPGTSSSPGGLNSPAPAPVNPAPSPVAQPTPMPSTAPQMTPQPAPAPSATTPPASAMPATSPAPAATPTKHPA